MADLILIFFAIWLVIAVFAVAKLARNHRSKAGRALPPDEAEEILYEEYAASGRSMKSFYTRIGGARGCLRFVVGKDRFWVTVMAPFNFIGNPFDLEHEIPFSDILNIQKKGKKLEIEYSKVDGTRSELELFPGSVEELYAYLKELCPK